MVGDFGQALALARQGDNEGVSWLYDTYHPSLLRYLKWEEPREAADIEGDVWLAVAQNLKRFKGDQQHFKAWLFTIARRRVIDERRKRSRNRMVYVVPESLYAYGSGGDMAQEAVDSLSAQEAISRLTAGIPKDQAEVIVLRVLGGLSVAEVAEITGKRPGTVRVLQHRALQHMSEESGAGREPQAKRVGKRGTRKR
ncbi:MAG: RNA polymerase sigma factor [Actinobacteria bacterium]|nr:RNA polymerase sigma factor [Actinomycetota bacterium]MCL5447291.1 RNA polymerase sigma factor [Actinomycetota bacterium]